jgi:hypothetical protein
VRLVIGLILRQQACATGAAVKPRRLETQNRRPCCPAPLDLPIASVQHLAPQARDGAHFLWAVTRGQIVPATERAGTRDFRVTNHIELEKAVRLGNIRGISLSGDGPSCAFRDSDLATIPSNVVDLRLDCLYRFSDGAVNALLKRSTKLTHLELIDQELSDQVFQGVSLPQLRHLNVRFNKLTDASLCPRPATGRPSTPREVPDLLGTDSGSMFIDATVGIAQLAFSAVKESIASGSQTAAQTTQGLNVNLLDTLDVSHNCLSTTAKTILRATFAAREDAKFFDESSNDAPISVPFGAENK